MVMRSSPRDGHETSPAFVCSLSDVGLDLASP